ncbi:hypothetical protein GCM10011352_37430 [Marinobacterium zhoushanense]|uniref:6-hydroxymethylpterin diphosphokinase MptE-like domain-containing protein n=1 Tax=Marinobacterium zhoushanense TaxID=1679163 RepID=A0ABQ1KTW7_9GAMM|nr:6-hydroxymethylpterin diphosphokinase MptE-like protein [Marinobacterium zhoushanense]GGC07659.1 hypothetical protein GCM10011352_37430 [Marinobacterium zhoushanense]
MSVSLDVTINAFNDRYLTELHQSQFSRQPAVEVLQQRFSRVLFDSKVLYLIIGTDSGLLSQYVSESDKPDNTRYVFIELPEIIERLGLETQPHPQVRIETPDSWERALEDFHFNEYAFLDRVRVYRSLAAQSDYTKCYGPLIWDTEQKSINLCWSQAYSLGLKAFLQTQLLNVADYQIPSGVLEGQYKEQTALILAAGPSLNDHFEWIRQNRERIYILAVSRIAKILIREKITPDFFVHVDPQDIAFNVSKEALQLSEQVPLIAANHAQPLLVSQWQSNVYFSGTRLPWESNLNEPTLDLHGPTVTNVALSSAIAMGFTRILFAGLDLCFDKQGFSHAKGSNEASSGPSLRSDTRRVKTNLGEEADTSPDYFAAIEALEAQAASAHEHDIQLINLSGNAARINGIDYISTNQLTFPPTQRVSVKVSSPTPEQRHLYLLALREQLGSVQQSFMKAQAAADKAKELSPLLLTQNGSINPEIQQKLNAYEAEIESLSPPMMRFCKVYGLGEFLADTNHKDADQWTHIDILDFGKRYFGTFSHILKEVIQLLEFVGDKISLRLEELSISPNIDALCKGWIKESAFLRADSWLKNHKVNFDLNTIEELRSKMKGEFESLTLKAESADQARCNGGATPYQLVDKATRMLQRNRIEELKSILSFLESNDRPEFHSGYTSLIKAYIAELEGHNQDAIREHQSIIEAQHMDIMEASLQRVLAISSAEKNHAQTLQAIECLSLISPHYLKHYGKFQRTAGDLAGAIESMTRHYEFFPNDTYNLLNLADIYISISEFKAARIVLEEALHHQPDNLAAKRLLSELPLLDND